MKTVFINGSPKKKLSVSSYLLGIIRLLVRGDVVKEQVRNKSDYARVLETVKDADVVVFGIPLYVDGVPSHMLAFLKEMESFCLEHNIKVRVYALSNGGFIEGCQNRPLMQVLENFCKRSKLDWCGGIGIGGGVMLNVLRIMFFVYLGIFVLNIVSGGVNSGEWLSMENVCNFAEQLATMLFFHLGVFFYGLRMGIAINKGTACGVKFTRVLLPSFLFILGADIFFVICSIFQGGIFRGWLAKK